MKKIFCLVLLILLPLNVLAEESNKQYKFYYIEKIYSKDFYEKGEKIEDYPFITDTWIYSDNIKTSLKKPDNEKDIVKEVPVLKYQEQKKVRYIIIDQTYSQQKINLQEIEVYNQDNKIEYSIQCSTCSSEFFALIQNTKIDFEYNYINNNTKMILDLKNEYFPDDLTIKLHFGGVVGKTVEFRVTVNNTNNLNDVYYRYKDKVSLLKYIVSSKKLKDVTHEERYEEEIKEVKGVTEIKNAKVVEQLTEYHYKVRVYQYYNEVKHYVDGYYYDLPGLIKDEDNYVEIIEPLPTPEVDTSTNIESNNIQNDESIKESEKSEETEETVKIEYLTKEVFVPIIQEKIKYQEKEIEKIVEIEVPKEVEKIVEKEIVKKEEQNYLLSYGIYLGFTLITRKMYKTFN